LGGTSFRSFLHVKTVILKAGDLFKEQRLGSCTLIIAQFMSGNPYSELSCRISYVIKSLQSFIKIQIKV